MVIRLMFLFCFTTIIVKAQTLSFWIYDTANVSCFYASGLYIPDTVAYLKKSPEQLNVQKIIIYWDRAQKQKYKEVKVGGNDSVVTYYRNGHINEMTIYVDKNGQALPDDVYIMKAWYDDGKKKVEQIVEGKYRSTIYYYHSGKIRWREVSMKGGILDMPDRYEYVFTENFCDNGQLIARDSISSTRLREIVSYHCNGSVAVKYVSNGLNVFGKYQAWYPNGQLEIDGQYDDKVSEDRLLVVYGSKRQGDWKYYDETGKLIKTEKYVNNVLIETIK